MSVLTLAPAAADGLMSDVSCGEVREGVETPPLVYEDSYPHVGSAANAPGGLPSRRLGGDSTCE